MKNQHFTFALLIVIIITFCSCNTHESKALTLIPLFSDHMVLQQEQEVPIWGTYTPEAKISATGSWGATASTESDENGKWKLKLQTPAAGGPYEIKITSSDSTFMISDVMIGEVWLASGQSNMEMPLTGYLPNEPIDNYQEEIANADYPVIRMFTAVKNMSANPLDNIVGQWDVCSPQTASIFSATGYFFARKLHQELNIPIGIIHTSWGGTVAEAWTSKEGLSAFPHFIKTIEEFSQNENVDQWTSQFKTDVKPNSLEDFESLSLDADEITAPLYDDAHWPRLQLPIGQTHTNQFIPKAKSEQELEGMFWYRKKFNLASIEGDYNLYMGAIDDADITYINGHKVGSTWDWQKKRNYKIPNEVLNVGENYIAILHYDGAGVSSIAGPLELKNDKGTSVKLDGEWAGLFYADIHDNNLLLYGHEDQDMLVDRPIILSSGPNQLPSSLYNAMLHPIIPYTIKGAIWYQGESNVSRAEEYESLFPDMIQDWRKKWNSDFPFYFVQIAPFLYGNGLSPELRDAQRKSLYLENTGMAITLDIGMEKSIHPGNKQDVGKRLAYLALNNDYNKDIIASGPLYKSHTIENKKLALSFEHIGSGLMLKESSGFEIAGEDGVYKKASAVLKDNQIELFNSSISNPTSARYGWQDYFNATLFNKEGLPTSSFSTE